MKEGTMYVIRFLVEFLDLKGDEYFKVMGKIKGVTGEKRKISLKVANIECVF